MQQTHASHRGGRPDGGRGRWIRAGLTALGLLVALSGCSPEMGQAPPTTITENSPERALYLDHTETGFGTGDATRDMSPTLTPYPTTLEALVAQPAFVGVFRWQGPVDSSIESTIVTSLSVTSVSNVLYRWRLEQVDRCGVVLARSAYAFTRASDGVQTDNMSLDATWGPGDMLRLTVEARRVDRGIGRLEIGVRDPDSFLRFEPGDPIGLESLPISGATPGTAEPPPGPLSNTYPAGWYAVPGTESGALAGGEFRWNNQRSFWWNTHRSRWDGILPTEAPPASRPSAWWIWKDLGRDPLPAQEISTRPANTPDTYWDSGCGTLYVFMSRGSTGISRFRRFLYEPSTDGYLEETRQGGVRTPEDLRGSKRVSIVKSPKGHLWAAVNHANRLLISRSTDRGDTWVDPVEIKATAAHGDTHWVVFESGGRVRLGVAATEDGSAEAARVHFLHIDQDDPHWKDPRRWTDETLQLPPHEGDEVADDELSATVYDNVVYVVGETEPLGTARSAQSPQLVLYRRDPAGSWSKHVIRRFTHISEHDRKRPVITVNSDTGHVLVGVARNDRDSAYLYRAPFDQLDVWDEHVLFEPSPGQEVYNARLPRFPVTEETGLLVLVEESGTSHRIWRQLVKTSPWSAEGG